MSVARFPEATGGPSTPSRGGDQPPSAGPPSARVTADGYDYGAQYDKALDVMKSLADQEYDQADKISVKARQAFGFASVFFGITQVVVNSSISALSHAQKQIVLALAIAAAVFVLLTAVLALRADFLKRFSNLSSQNVLDSVNESVQKRAPVSYDFVALYATALDERRGAVRVRRAWLRTAQIAAIGCVLILAAQFIVVLADRI